MNDIEFYLDNPIPKIRWKSLVNRTIYSEKLNPLLKINVNSVKDSLRLPTKLKYLCGSYVLQANRQKFNKNNSSNMSTV